MNWFTEDPWSPMLLCSLAGGLCLVLGVRAKFQALMVIGAFLCLACPVVWVVEQQIVTDAERVEMRVLELVDTFRSDNSHAFGAFFDPTNAKLQAEAMAAITMVDVDDVHVKELKVIDAGPAAVGRTMRSTFRANGNVNALGHTAYQASRWRLEWQLRDGKWTIISAIRLHPLRDEEIPILSAGQ